MQYLFTNTRQLRTAFREEFKGQLDFSLIPNHRGTGKMYKATTRLSFINWLDYLYRENLISERLARTATFEPD